MKISKNHALNLIDSKILAFQKILDEATYDNRYNEEYDLAYYGTENLLNELFSEVEVKNFRNHVTNPVAFFGDEVDHVQELQDYKNHLKMCISQLNVYKEKIQFFWNNELDRFEGNIDFIKSIPNLWKKLESKGTKYPILVTILISAVFILITNPPIFLSPTSVATAPSTERAELTIKNVSYDVDWIPLKDGNYSELLNDKYQVTVNTCVTNKNNSKFDAEITNAEYYFLDANNESKNYWVSPHEQVSVFPGLTFNKIDNMEIFLKPGNYTLHTRIEYKDKKDILTPLMFSAKLKISYGNSEIIDNHDWQ